MMTSFSTNELATMQAAQESAMMDTCKLLTRVTGFSDAYGYNAVMWIEGAATPCGLDLRASREVPNAEAHWYDAQLRLAISTPVNNIDRVKITHRHGVALAVPLEFDLTGETRRGASGLVLELKEATSND